jgi:hypothetical protein
MATSPLTEDQIRDKSTVTVALATSGYMFSMLNSDVGLMWVMNFSSTDDPQGVEVEVQAEGAWITIVSDPKIGEPTADLALQLLRLNAKLVLARICIGKAGNFLVVSQFQKELLSGGQLRAHIQAAQVAVADARKLTKEVEGATGGSAPTSSVVVG